MSPPSVSNASLRPSGTASVTLFRLAFLPGWAVIAATTGAFLAGASLPLTYQLIPLAASVVLLGLPHGAVDHLALPRTRNEGVTLRWLAAIGVLYAVVGGLYAAVWFLAPVGAVAAFILMTWVHWGQGEIYPLVALADAAHLGGRLERGLTAATRGALPMLVPFVAFPDQYELVVTTLVGLFDADAAATAAAAFTPTTRLAVAAIVGGLVAVTLGIGAVAASEAGWGPWLLDAGETGLLLLFFATVPPIFAIGLYFCFWHSLRHIVRLLAVDSRAAPALDGRRYGAALARFARDAAPLSAASLVLLGLLYLAVPGSIDSPLSLVGTYLVLIAVLTLPHVVVVAWMDHEQRLWRPGA